MLIIHFQERTDCWEAEKNLKTTPGSECAGDSYIRQVYSNMVLPFWMGVMIVENAPKWSIKR